MTLEIITVPCLSDNYAYLLHDPVSNETALVDAPEAAPIKAELEARGWSLSHILITHHHYDHIDAVPELASGGTVKVIGARADAHRLPPLDLQVSDGDQFEFGGEPVQVLDVSGHTIGHVAYYLPMSDAVFTADSLMALGCGRLFEGTPVQMWTSLQKLRALPMETEVYSGHEYTLGNAKFALTIDPGNAALISRAKEIEAARRAGKPTIPSDLRTECATNPFLRPENPEIRENIGMTVADDTDVFAKIRYLKDSF